MPSKFICDAMLGKLARWLRLLGYDVDYPNHKLSDIQLIEQANAKQRTLVTRDALLVARAQKIGISVIHIHKTALPDQLHEFAQQFSPNQSLQFEGTRCSLCNTPLIATNPTEIKSLQSKLKNPIHEKTLTHHQEFWYCPNCYQAYWKGRQWARITNTLDKINNQRKKSTDV